VIPATMIAPATSTPALIQTHRRVRRSDTEGDSFSVDWFSSGCTRVVVHAALQVKVPVASIGYEYLPFDSVVDFTLIASRTFPIAVVTPYHLSHRTLRLHGNSPSYERIR